MQLREEKYARQDVYIPRHPYKEYFNEMRFRPVLDGNGMDTYQVTGEQMRFAVFRTSLFDQVYPVPSSRYDTYLAPPLPRSRAFAKEIE